MVLMNQQRSSDEDFNEESNVDDDDDSDHLYSTINCKVGDKYNYVMATQSSLFANEDDGDHRQQIQIKTGLELKCLQKINWLNRTDGHLKPGQIFEVMISKMQPIRIKNQQNNSQNSGQTSLQMASLFQTLKNLDKMMMTDNKNETKIPNLKIGAVNGFFSEFSKNFADWFMDLLRKLFGFMQSLMSKKRQKQQTPVPVKNIFKCDADDNVDAKKPTTTTSTTTTTTTSSSRHRKRQNPMVHRSNNDDEPVNLEQFTENYSEMYGRPFRFIQLSDGSIQNIRLSDEDQDPNVRQFKKFIARSFATQLDERKKRTVEESDLGLHYCNYQMEFDNEEMSGGNNSEPQNYLNRSSVEQQRQRLSKRSSSSSFRDDHESEHIVSVIRQFKTDDIIIKRRQQQQQQGPGFRSEDLKSSESIMKNLDFNVQEVQLIRGNMVVASGGYFQGFIPTSSSTTEWTMKNNDRTKRSTQKTIDEHVIDRFLREHLDLNMQYSMVKLNTDDDTKQQRKQRNRRSINGMATESETADDPSLSTTIINYGDKINDNNNNNNNDQNVKLMINSHQQPQPNQSNSNENNVICRQYQPESSSNWMKWKKIQELIKSNDEDNEIDSGKVIINDNENENDVQANHHQECYEHKTFGSDYIGAHFNRSIITKTLENDEKEIETRFYTAARLFNFDFMSGRMDIRRKKDTANNNDAVQLTLNLMGAEYENLNICDIRNKHFSHSGLLPLYLDKIWFNTKIELAMRYKLTLKLDLPFLNCENQPTNTEILKRAMADKLQLKQISRMEYSLITKANFMVINTEMALNVDFDVNSLVDFADDCLGAKTDARPLNVNVKFIYEFFNPICDKWMMDSWKPKPLSWKLGKDYRQSWSPNNCTAAADADAVRV
ncbi:hypothetical protein HUG17_4112 [Dermatophagoides farinae]|uniref:Uncharacterized protein n=1 Tax=Dermatophagoides farinae TaxID=6954 RepID=A0A9D4NWM6_DERFA|nr:hypothetical protein HUG17_4112 [Dermatophagoides farinae]